MDVSENSGCIPNHPLKNRVFHYKPPSTLGCFPIFGNTQIGMKIPKISKKPPPGPRWTPKTEVRSTWIFMKLKLFQLGRVVRPEGFSGGFPGGGRNPHGGLGGHTFLGSLLSCNGGVFFGATLGQVRTHHKAMIFCVFLHFSSGWHQTRESVGTLYIEYMLIHPGFVEGINYFLSYTQQMYPCSLSYVNTSCCVNEGCVSQVNDWFGKAFWLDWRVVTWPRNYHVLWICTVCQSNFIHGWLLPFSKIFYCKVIFLATTSTTLQHETWEEPWSLTLHEGHGEKLAPEMNSTHASSSSSSSIPWKSRSNGTKVAISSIPSNSRRFTSGNFFQFASNRVPFFPDPLLCIIWDAANRHCLQNYLGHSPGTTNPPTLRTQRTSWWFQPHLKNLSQTGNLPQIGVNIKNLWNHHLEEKNIWPESPCRDSSIFDLLIGSPDHLRPPKRLTCAQNQPCRLDQSNI